jgi:lipid-binding SYLF domain-containing protein
MPRFVSLKATVLILLASLTLGVALRSYAQPTGKFNDAVTRSALAAEIVAKLSQLPEQQMIPRALIDRAEAIGIFHCQKIDLLIEHGVKCPGAISRRLQNGWSLPAYFRLFAGGFGRPNSALGDAPVVILLFNDRLALELLTKSGKLKGEKQALAGPVGPTAAHEIDTFHAVHVIAYGYNTKGLWGRNLKETSWLKTMGIGDEKINQNLYRRKGAEVLAGASIDRASLPSGVTDFQKALERYWPADEPNSQTTTRLTRK